MVAGAVVAVAAALLIGVPFLYTQVIADDAPDRLSVSSSGDASGRSSSWVSGLPATVLAKPH